MRPDDVIAVFADPDAAEQALVALRDEGVAGARVASPAPFPAVHRTGHPGPWRALGWIALIGGLTGLSSAAAFQVASMESMNMIVGGKPIVSWTAFGVIMFELTLLFAGVSNFSALVILSAFTRRRLPKRARKEVTSERIVVVVPLGGVPDERRNAIKRSLSDAVEVLS
ncbi:MAG TPA: quinol:electron acceptor oxidoreductase subunit ActD [Polyangiaceae bacterium]|nr:quinol:electron acceptor oxidoreductase subunit ActD [Polyangiaceae bacterium]